MISARRFIAIGLAATLAGCGGGTDTSQSGGATAPGAAAPLRTPSAALALVSPVSAANQLMDFAEGRFPQFFPEHQASQSDVPPFLYRHYSNGTYLGVVVTQNAVFTFNGVYTLGGPLGDLSYQGQLDAFITPVDAGGGTANRNLVVTASGFGSASINVGSVPLPSSQPEFCNGLAADTAILTGLGQALGGSLIASGCSFSASTGSVTANLYLSTGYDTFFYPMTITYAFQ